MTPCHPLVALQSHMEDLYRQYHRRDIIHPDPLEVLYDYPDVRDREIAAFVASSLAYGRVVQILKSVYTILGRMAPSPHVYLQRATSDSLQQVFSDFRHRFTVGDELASALLGLKKTIERFGSLNACFTAHLKEDDETVLPALCALVRELASGIDGRPNSLLPLPEKGSACKRLNLFLRWLVRQDDVDPGGWRDVPASKLIIPMDTHMHRIGLALGLTRRRQADIRAALEMTACFRTIAPEDPLRYDFALTRLGIRRDGDMEAFLHRCRDVLGSLG